MIQLKILPSIEKCFADEQIENKKALTRISMLKNERLSFQLAFTNSDARARAQIYELLIDSPLKDSLTLHRVEQVPVKIPCYPDCDDPDYLRKQPGLYPDLMIPFSAQPRLYIAGGALRTLMITVHDPSGIQPGIYPVTLGIKCGEETASVTLTIEVIGAMLPKSDLIYTCWFHSDCLAQYYRVDVFSEEYWRIVRNFIRAAVSDGQNMLLTPVFTPPLDTAVGKERLTVQLVDVEVKEEGGYAFGFDRFDRFVGIALEEGIEYIEISHLYTQWGCANAPKIMAQTKDGYRKIFGWETDAHAEEYKTFLAAFLPALIDHAKQLGIAQRLWFHISDEPNLAHLEAYLDARQTVSALIGDSPCMDALSNFEFYRTGSVPTPIPATNQIEPFYEAGIKGLWTYYCCSQGNEVSNRFLAMPGYRTRILGIQLFKYQIAGFLHWGFNFYNSHLSGYPIDPYAETSGDDFFPSGDGFVVYPAPDGTAYPTLHGRAFAEGLQDLRALRLCAERIGFARTLALVEEEAEMPITFKEYPRSNDYILSLREKINCAIKESL